MLPRIFLVMALFLLSMLAVACGTIEIGLEDDLSQTVEDVEAPAPVDDADEQLAMPTTTTTTTLPTEIPTKATAGPTATAEVETEQTTVSATTGQAGPAGWQRFYDPLAGIELWYPPGTIAEVGEPARPEFWSAEFPEGIIEEQVFVVRILQEEGAAFGPSGPQAILEVKLVANTQAQTVGEMADLFSKRCPGQVVTPIQPTTINVQLSGYRYGCEGIDGIVFNELWSPHPTVTDLVVGATWTDMSSPLSDQILATVSFAAS